MTDDSVFRTVSTKPGQAHLYQSGLKGVFLKRRDAPADRLYFDKAFIYALVTRPRQSIVVLSPCYAVCHL